MALTTESTPPKTERPEPPEEEKALVTDYKKRIEAARKLVEKRFEQYDTNRKYVRGEVHDDGQAGLVRTNLILSTLATLLPQIYAKDPDISVSPSEAVDPSEYMKVRQFGKTAEIVLQRKLVREAKLKRRIKAQVRAAMTCEVGWLKVTYQKDIQTDPVIVNRIEDIQENLQRLEAANRSVDEAEGSEADLERANLELELKALQAKVEIVKETGFAIDKLLTESVLILDPTVRDFDDYERAAAIAQEIWFDEDTFEAQFGYSPGTKATRFRSQVPGRDANADQQQGGKDSEQGTCFYRVFEIWDKRRSTVLTWCEGEEGWCRPPFNPQRRPRRWYPFYALQFNTIDGQFYGVSDVQLLIELQDEYNTTRTNYAEHRRLSLPIRVVRQGGSLTPDDVTKIQGARSMEVVVVSGAPGTPLQDELAVLEHPPIDPAVYDTMPIRADIEEISGAGDSVRGSVLKAKTATEAEIMKEGLMSRTAERQDTIEDVITVMAEDALQVALQELSPGEVIEIAGPQAQWPAMSREQILDQVTLQVRAGSTGKPNKQRERESWTQLVPVVENSMQRVAEFEAMGRADLAEAQRQLVRETFRIFDERIDVDAFLGPAGQGNPNGQMAAQFEQAVMQLQQAMMENETLTAQVQELQMQLETVGQQAQEAGMKVQSRDAEINAKREIADADRTHQVTLEDKKFENQRALAKESFDREQAAKAAERAHAERIAQIESAKQISLKRLEVAGVAEPGEETKEEKSGAMVAQALQQIGQMMAAAMQQVAQSNERLAEVMAAPRVPVYNSQGRITEARPVLNKSVQ